MLNEEGYKYKALFKDTLIFALGNIGSKIIVFFLVPFYTYYLTPDEYGISDLVFTVSQLAVPFFSLVIFDAVIRYALQRKERPQDALLVGYIVWFLGSALAIALTTMRTGAVAAHSIMLFGNKNFATIGMMGLGNVVRSTILILTDKLPDRELHCISSCSDTKVRKKI